MSLRKYGSKFSKLECLFFISSTTFPPSVTFFMTQGLKECLLFISSTTPSVTLCNCSRLNALGNNYQVKATFYWGQPVRTTACPTLVVFIWNHSILFSFSQIESCPEVYFSISCTISFCMYCNYCS